MWSRSYFEDLPPTSSWAEFVKTIYKLFSTQSGVEEACEEAPGGQVAGVCGFTKMNYSVGKNAIGMQAG
jgi:hypothetical protein